MWEGDLTVSLEGIVAAVGLIGTATYIAARRHPEIFVSIYTALGAVMLLLSTFMLGWDIRGAVGASYQLNSWPIFIISLLVAVWMSFLALNLRRLSEKPSNRHDDERGDLS